MIPRLVAQVSPHSNANYVGSMQINLSTYSPGGQYSHHAPPSRFMWNTGAISLLSHELLLFIPQDRTTQQLLEKERKFPAFKQNIDEVFPKDRLPNEEFFKEFSTW